MPKPRKKNDIAPARTMRIYCEGEKTEPYYFEGYISSTRSDNRAAVVHIQPTRKNTPVQLVDEAVKFKKSSACLPGDEVWVVYDRESEAKYSHKLHACAWDKATSAGVEIAISNVCFEYWILLHLVDTSVAYTCFDDLQKKSPLDAKIRGITGSSYSKSGRELFRHLSPYIASAISRAKLVNKDGSAVAPGGARPFEINPFTDVPRVLQAIKNFK